MSKGKTWQRVASAFLAAVMTFSTFNNIIKAHAADKKNRRRGLFTSCR